MVPNPFIALARSPVETLGLVAYTLALAAGILMSTSWSLRTGATLAVRYKANRHRDEWLTGPFNIGVIPPSDWSLTASAILFVWAVTAFMASALVWVVS